MASDMEALAGVTPETMADEQIANAKAFSINNAAPGLAKLPLLVITSDDGSEPVAAALVKEIEAQGGKIIPDRPGKTSSFSPSIRNPVTGRLAAPFVSVENCLPGG